MKIGVSYNENNSQHKAIFDSIYEKMNHMYEKAQDHSIKFGNELKTQNNSNDFSRNL